MLVAPTEPPAIKTLGTVSSTPERYGADILFIAKKEKCGVQRKEVKDFIASIQDGRLQREIAQMQVLAQRLLVIEGKLQWTLDGDLMGKQWGIRWTHRMHRGAIWSVQGRGVWVISTDSIQQTIDCCRDFEAYCRKAKHTMLDSRPGAVGVWGKPNSREFGMHLLMGIDGVGPELAGRIWDRWGRVPWSWDVGMDELMEVDGVGKVKAKKMLECFGGSGDG